MKKKGKKNLLTKELDQLSMLFNGRSVVLQEKKEADGSFICRAAFHGISASLFGATGKGESKEAASSMARQNLAGVFAGTLIHGGLLKAFKASKGNANGALVNICKPIFDYALNILKKPEYSCLLNAARVFPPLSDEDAVVARSARKEILAFAATAFKQHDEFLASKGARTVQSVPPTAPAAMGLQPLPPPPPPPPGNPPEERRNGKRAADQPSTSSGVTAAKNARIVIEEDDDDCVVLESSSESSSDIEEIPQEATLGNTVRTPQKAARGEEEGYLNPYLEMAEKYSEADLLGVTMWNGAKEERKRVAQYRNRFSRELFSSFDMDIWKHYKSNSQDDDIYNWKMSVRMTLLDVAQKVFPGCFVNMFAVGSTINGCGSYNSDMDLCLVLYNRDGTITETQDFAKRNLNKIFHELTRARKDVVSKCQFIRHAVVPIIKLEMVMPNSLEVDINMNNIAGVYNSHLMHYYSRVDDRFPALCLIVKHWAINAGINDSLLGTFNSYSLILLVLHYLQVGVYPAILPNLQYLYPNRFGDRPELSDLNLFGEFTPPLPQRILNEQSVGEILIGFFEYYSRFDFANNAISIRKGTIFARNLLPAENMKYPLYIEEPFDGKNTARCVRREFAGTIREAFKHAAAAFRDRPPSLEDINVSV